MSYIFPSSRKHEFLPIDQTFEQVYCQKSSIGKIAVFLARILQTSTIQKNYLTSFIIYFIYILGSKFV